jgi:hypothetical protein
VLWLDAAPLAWATARAEAPAAPRPAPPPPSPPPRGRWLAAGGVVLALALAGGVAAVRWREPASAAAPAAPAPVAAAPVPGPSGPVEPTRELFGGRTPEWWQERLEQLAARGGPEARELREWTLNRARANGLQVAEEGGQVRVTASGAASGAAR